MTGPQAVPPAPGAPSGGSDPNPPVGNGGPQVGAPGAPPAPGTPTPEPQNDGLTPEQLRDALAKARTEAAQLRTTNKTLADAQKAAEDAKLSELDRANKKA